MGHPSALHRPEYPHMNINLAQVFCEIWEQRGWGKTKVVEHRGTSLKVCMPPRTGNVPVREKEVMATKNNLERVHHARESSV